MIMVIVLKKRASNKEINSIEKRINASKSFDLSKHCGKLKLKEDSLRIQKDLRNEWK